jgi:SAM-dependent methyltransferase
MTIVTAIKCPICQHDQTEEVKQGVRDNSDIHVLVCLRCAFQFFETTRSSERDYYRNGYRLNHNPVPGMAMSPDERFHTYRPLMGDRAKRFRNEVSPGSTVLEVGCSSGFFLDAIQDDYTVYGAEWNPEDAAYVRDVGELPCEEGNIEDIYPGKTFTAICAYAVLEHQSDPMAWLAEAQKRLIRGGYLIIEVPNSEDALLTLFPDTGYKDFWYRDCHPSNFNVSNLAHALVNNGFEANVSTYQKYSLENHLNWRRTGKPMGSAEEAMDYFAPIPKEHGAAAYFNRWFMRIDREYRLMLENAKAGDTLIGVGRLHEI